MKFNDLTLVAGRIQSRRRHDTSALAEQAVETCRQMLKQLRAGAEFVPHGIAAFPPFGVSLGPPEWLMEIGQQVEAPGRFFCVAEPGMPAFQFNLVLPAEPLLEIDLRAVATALGLSSAMADSKVFADNDAVMAAVTAIAAIKPVLATAMIPSYDVPLRVLTIAADFSTCFAAALLLEEEEAASLVEMIARASHALGAPVELAVEGPLNALYLAINYYMSTGDSIGEGLAMEQGDTTIITLAYAPDDPVDSEDFRRLVARLKQIQMEEINLNMTKQGTEGRFACAGLHVANADIPRLAELLTAKPGPLGWGSMRAYLISQGVIQEG